MGMEAPKNYQRTAGMESELKALRESSSFLVGNWVILVKKLHFLR